AVGLAAVAEWLNGPARNGTRQRVAISQAGEVVAPDDRLGRLVTVLSVPDAPSKPWKAGILQDEAPIPRRRPRLAGCARRHRTVSGPSDLGDLGGAHESTSELEFTSRQARRSTSSRRTRSIVFEGGRPRREKSDDGGRRRICECPFMFSFVRGREPRP